MGYKNRLLEAAYQLRGWSQQAFADLSGVSQPMISDYVHGKKCPTADTINKMCEALGDGTTPRDIGFLVFGEAGDQDSIRLDVARSVTRATLRAIDESEAS